MATNIVLAVFIEVIKWFNENTGRQLQTMLALEGLLYTLGAAALALVLILLTAPLFGNALSDLKGFHGGSVPIRHIETIVHDRVRTAVL